MATTIENFILSVKTVGTESIGRAQTAMKNLSDQTKKTQGSLDDISSKVNEFANNMGNVPAPVNAVAQSLGRLGAVGGILGGVAAGFAAMGMGAVQAADQLDDLSAATGMSGSQLMSLKFAIIAAGGQADTFEKIAGKLSQSIGEAAEGNENLQKAFQKLGVYVTNAAGQVRPTSEILNDLGIALAKVEDPAVRAALATQLLGREAARLDTTKLKVEADPELDRRIKALADLNSILDQWKAEKAKAILMWFGDLAILGKDQGISSIFAKLTEDLGRLSGYILNLPTDAIKAGWNALVPEWLRIGKAVGLGDPLIDLANKAEQARKAVQQSQDTLKRLGVTPSDAGGGRGTQAFAATDPRRLDLQGPGGFGKTPEATLKAIAESEKRIANAGIDARRQAQLQANAEATALALSGANERMAIDIKAAGDIKNIQANLAADLAKERQNIFNQERLNDAQKEAEFVAKSKELNAKAALDIAKIRIQATEAASKATAAANAKEFAAYQAERDQIAKELADEENRIRNIIKSGEDLVRTYKDGTAELQLKATFEEQTAYMTEREKKYAQEAFNIKREEYQLLQQIARIKDLPYEERLKQEEAVKKATEERTKILMNSAMREDAQRQNFVDGWDKAYRQWLDDTTNTFKQAEDAFTTLQKGFEDAIVRFVQTGKLSFRDLFNSLLAQAARVAANNLLMSIFGSIGGTAGLFGRFLNPNGGFGTGNAYGNLDIGGFLANGGPAQAGKPYIVGENGPELFVPNSSGTVIPNGTALGGGQNITQVTYNIQAVDASSFRSLVARDPEFIYNVTEQGRRSLPTRSRR